MKLFERIKLFDILFEELQLTNSRNEKESIVNSFLSIYPELKDDWVYILETLDDKHPIGWTFVISHQEGEYIDQYRTIKEIIQNLEARPDTKEDTCYSYEYHLGEEIGTFIEPIVNRTLRLGIGKSLLDKSNLTPMLAKKYEGQKLYDQYIVTEKLDGNRCIAHYEDGRWQFTSRSGKSLKVDFDMTGLPTEYIYDGEILSLEQTNLSIARGQAIRTNDIFAMDLSQSQRMFNKTSGLINSKGPKKGLVYNIFDIITSKTALKRKQILTEEIQKEVSTQDVRILPVLYIGNNVDQINRLLDCMVQMGGEGIMLNDPNIMYLNKRTDALLKYKQVKSIDMRVIDIIEGKGKYERMVGALSCYCKTDDGKEIICDVGSGLSDYQRFDWYKNKSQIVGKIVQIAYHEITQERDNIGTNLYSLRFPRLTKVRVDKKETSEY